MSRTDEIRLTAAWAGVLLTAAGMLGGIALGAGKLMYAPKADYATKSDVDSLRWAMQGISNRLDIILIQRVPADIAPHRGPQSIRRP